VSLNAGYGQGTYVASASSEAYNAAWYAFSKTSVWTSGLNYASSAPYQYNGAAGTTTVDINGNSYTGDWLQIQQPVSIVLSSYAILVGGGAARESPSRFWVLGSRDGTSWNLVDQRTGITSWTNGGTLTFSVQAAQAFTYFRIVVNQVTGYLVSYNYAAIGLTLNGTIEGPSISADGRLGIGVSNPVQALEVAGNMVTGGTVSSGTGLMFRNALYNGDMRISQRGSSFVNPSGQYTLDRWYIQGYGAVGNGTVSQIQSGLANFSSAFQLVTTSTTTGNWMISQSLETRDVVRFQGQTVTVSFWYRIPVSFTATWSPALFWTTAVDTSITNGIAGTPNGAGSGNMPNTTAWTYTQFQAFVPSTAQALSVIFSTYNNVVNGATIQITGLQLEKGTVATPFEVRPYATELALCQRYYTEIPFSGSHFTGGGTGGGRTIGSLAATNGSVCCSGIYFPVSMRINPTPNYYGAGSSPGVFTFYTGSSGGQVGVIQSTSNVVTAQISTMMLAINIGTTSIIATGGSSGWFDMGWGSTSLGITLSAEL
jgi:hypothetical protein